MNSSDPQTKAELRSHLRAVRQTHVENLPDATKGLLFRAPPGPLRSLIAEDAKIAVYHGNAWEPACRHYASHFAEADHEIALPRFADKNSPMRFASWTDHYGDTDLAAGAFSMQQPGDTAPMVEPDILFVPLIGFGPEGERLGQGGGHYDRYLADHPNTLAIGLAWDCQLSHAIPIEEHDRQLDAVVTPTRFYGPFNA